MGRSMNEATGGSWGSGAKHRMSPIRQQSKLPQARRVVVKIGSSSLTSIEESMDELAIATMIDVLAKAQKKNPHLQIILVSSGAIAAGLAPLGLSRRPKDLATQQAAAAVGQSLLMTRYTESFARYGVTVSQVLITAEDLMMRDRYRNARRQLERLLELGVMPIINENDAVATAEVKFGDNDRIAALVAHTVKADALVLLSDVDAVYTKHPADGGVKISHVDSAADLEGLSIGSAGKAGVGSGGMVTKVQAARLAASSGIPALVTSATLARQALAGQEVGTWFSVTGQRRSVQELWLEHLANIKGSLIIDEGAAAAVRRRRSLLAAGVVGVEGHFDGAEPVALRDLAGGLVAHGLSSYSSQEMAQMVGLHSHEIRQKMGDGFDGTLVHADNIALLSWADTLS